MQTPSAPYKPSSKSILLCSCLAAAAIAILLTCALCAGVGLLLALWPYCPAQPGYEMPQTARDYVAEHHLIEPNETILAYYDATPTCNGTQSVILTNTRIIDHLQGISTSIALTDIADIQHREETIIGTTILVVADSGEVMSIDIAPDYGGQIFYTALLQAWRSAAQQTQQPNSMSLYTMLLTIRAAH